MYYPQIAVIFLLFFLDYSNFKVKIHMQCIRIPFIYISPYVHVARRIRFHEIQRISCFPACLVALEVAFSTKYSDSARRF